MAHIICTYTKHDILVPGPKLPNDPPLDLDGHVLYFPAKESKLLSPLPNSVSTIFASSRVGTRICLATALTASGGSPYSSFENAFEIESNIPIDREDCDLCCVCDIIGENASVYKVTAATNTTMKRREQEVMIRDNFVIVQLATPVLSTRSPTEALHDDCREDNRDDDAF